MKRKNKHLVLLVFCLVITLFFIYPYFQSVINFGHDLPFHLGRIQGLADNIKEFQFFPKVHFNYNFGYGYGSPMFYSDLFLMLPALLVAFGLPVIVGYKLMVLFCTFLSIYLMALSVKKISRKEFAPYLAALLYAFTVYRFSDVFVRCAFGEIIAFVFMPIAVWGIYECLYGDTKKWWILALGFSGLLLSHNITFLLTVLIFAVILLICLPRLKEKGRLSAITKAAALSLGLTAFYLFPMFEQMNNGIQYIYNWTAKHYPTAENAMLLPQLFTNKIVFNSFNTDVYNSLSVSSGWFLPLLSLCLIPLWKKRNIVPHYSWLLVCAVIGFLSIILCTNLFPWDSFPALTVIQFPWRFMMLVVTFLCYPAAIGFSELAEGKYEILLSAVLTLLIIVNAFGLSRPTYHYVYSFKDSDSYFEISKPWLVTSDEYRRFNFFEVAAGEYLPLNSSVAYEYGGEILDSQLNILSSKRTQHATSSIFDLETPLTENTTLVLPIIYYKGYAVKGLDEEGKLVYNSPVSYNKSTFTLEAEVPAGVETLIVYYKGTLIQLFSNLVSLGTLFGWLGWKGFSKVRNNKKLTS